MKSGKSFENGQHLERGVALHVQPLVRQKAEHLGARSTEWLAQLPTLDSLQNKTPSYAATGNTVWH